ncbi:MAG: hypothetical protein HY744_31895 [Deltaproteobacteria bacterium]|nr:hypothetical protein [Deltaproteobacteria bacterium]
MSSQSSIRRGLLPFATGLSLIAAAGCVAGEVGSDEQNETWDPANAPETFGVRSMKIDDLPKEAALEGYLPQKPWSDTYWPLNKKGLSNRWISDESFESFEAQTKSAQELLKAAPAEGQQPWAPSWALSPAEKYDVLVRDGGFAMTKEGWTVYKQYEDYEGNWGWMGHCHGWAPAAYIEKTPAASVVVEIDGKQVLFTEGDIRGLLTKAHASNGTSEGTAFMGTRCNARTIVKDELGRIVDGTTYEQVAGQDKEANTETAKTIFIKRNFWSQHHVLTYAESIGGEEEKVLQATAVAKKPEGAFVVKTYASVADYQKQKAEAERIFVYNKECRDTNAGSFHLVLVQYLSDLQKPEAKRGFVADVTREDEVWNQPAYGFESKIESVQNLADIDDPLKAFRAEGTVKIAKVVTQFHYGVENGPYVDYDDENSSRISSKEYRYTLEIDEKGYVIGGEWDLGSSSWSSSPAPDFLWAPQGKVTDSKTVKYSVIEKLHACSLEVDRAKEIATPQGDKIQAVDCKL